MVNNVETLCNVPHIVNRGAALFRGLSRGPDGGTVKFDIDPHRKHCLLNGLDDIGLTMEKAPRIDSYETQMAQARPWV